MRTKPTIFIVDDDLIVRSVVAAVVRRDGMESLAFDSAETFLEAKAFTGPGVLVLDLIMPGMGGLELQKRMLTEAPTLPVIVLSATTDVDSALKAMRHRAVDFIRKPFDADELLRAIQSAVIQNQAMRSVEEERKGAQLRFGELSQGEQDLLLLLSEGMAEQQIAQSIGVPAGQLQGMLESLCTRMNAASMIELVQLSLLVGSEVSRERLPGVVAGVVNGVVTGVAAGEVGSTLSAATKAAA